MFGEQVLNEIRDLNLSYLLLAQSLLRADRAAAVHRLGLSDAVADVVLQLSPQQIVRIATRSQMLCSMRFDDELVWGLLTDSHAPSHRGTADRLHASLLMATARNAVAA